MSKNKVRHQIRKAKNSGMTAIDVARMRAIAKKEAEKMEHGAIEKSFLAMLAIPLNVLVNDYWSKTAKRRAPKFINDVLDLFEAWEMGVVDNDDLKDLLKEYAGVTIPEVVEEYKNK